MRPGGSVRMFLFPRPVFVAVMALLCAGFMSPPRAAAAGKAPPAAQMGGMTSMNNVSLQFAEYRGDPAELSGRVDRYLAGARQAALTPDPAALIVPHAGYVFSAPVAAYAYQSIRGKTYDTVVVVGPSHRFPFQGISVVDSPRFVTPLGTIPIDTELVKELRAASPEIVYLPEAHSQEHSVEVQIPFLQRTLGNFSLVMAVMGNWSPSSETAFIHVLAKAMKKKRILLVASSDLSHYKDYKTARKMDDKALDFVKKLDSAGLVQSDQRGECELCGILPVHLAMSLAEGTGAKDVRLLNAASSGDTAGPKDQVVGYAAVAFLPAGGGKTSKEGQEPKKFHGDGPLGEMERTRLLQIARQTITEFVKTGKAPVIVEGNQRLQAQTGAFVTIERNGQLRGCIGNFHTSDPLFKTISSMAVAACSQDPRFPPMRPSELGDMKLEISVLTPMRRISDINEIQVGRHGLYILKGGHGGTLLPQVATDYGWDRTTFLQQLCRKAGLPPDAWKEGAEIYVYEAQVFGEKE